MRLGITLLRRSTSLAAAICRLAAAIFHIQILSKASRYLDRDILLCLRAKSKAGRIVEQPVKQLDRTHN